jgi:hypothetical protein
METIRGDHMVQCQAMRSFFNQDRSPPMRIAHLPSCRSSSNLSSRLSTIRAVKDTRLYSRPLSLAMPRVTVNIKWAQAGQAKSTGTLHMASLSSRDLASSQLRIVATRLRTVYLRLAPTGGWTGGGSDVMSIIDAVRWRFQRISFVSLFFRIGAEHRPTGVYHVSVPDRML